MGRLFLVAADFAAIGSLELLDLLLEGLFLLARHALVGGLPGGIAAARLGPRRAVLIGLALMTVAGVTFAFADDPWTLPRDRRSSCSGAYRYG